MDQHYIMSYLSEPKARSLVGGYFHLGDLPTRKYDTNGAVHVKANIIQTVVTPTITQQQ